jgi:hypothetical protein
MRLEMTSHGKAAKSKLRFPHLPHDSWKSHRDSHIPTLTTNNQQPTKPMNLNLDEKCQPSARSKVSTIPPSAQGADMSSPVGTTEVPQDDVLRFFSRPFGTTRLFAECSQHFVLG